MILNEFKGILEMITKNKVFLEWYKTSISIKYDGIDESVEGLPVSLREKIMNKVFLYSNG